MIASLNQKKSSLLDLSSVHAGLQRTHNIDDSLKRNYVNSTDNCVVFGLGQACGVFKSSWNRQEDVSHNFTNETPLSKRMRYILQDLCRLLHDDQ